MGDLNLLPTLELLKELFVRFDHCVFIGMKELADREKTDISPMEFQKSYKGNAHTCMGLCFDMAREIGDEHEKEEMGGGNYNGRETADNKDN